MSTVRSLLDAFLGEILMPIRQQMERTCTPRNLTPCPTLP
jgi:hypothetical protein